MRGGLRERNITSCQPEQLKNKASPKCGCMLDQVVDEFTVAALEASSDACLRARNFAEFLKSTQHLVLTAYPLLAARHQV